ncbi:wax ester/triacylglycerol synthase domain-containing protein [Streptomyces millisiae]|uniref:Wax ester/triacylglycerol synthase family O-acyltransferase n=1 Tax=Streptomyces millisiae TaxID=3075542 RepID=A0ABU2LH56_9ACTN|nr:wax ester/triacylglycerol synthase domain-containing protein [Streptomyces sp. DSM 44918]MDT0316916.1 wax ester/triacylglycerol synthase family O-acyltransferase [Streptomyces sp. DSM 44918]
MPTTPHPADTARPAFPALDRHLRRMAHDGSGHFLLSGLVLELAGPPPTIDELRAHVRERLPLLPTPSDAPVERHVRELRVTPGPHAAAAAHDELVNRPLACPEEPWDVWLVHGFGTDRHLLCYRAHHALHDGLTVARISRLLFGTAPATPAAPRPPAPRPPFGARVAGLTRVTRDAAQLLRPAPRRPLLDLPRKNERLLASTTVPVGRLRSAAGRLGCSVLDVHLAALSRAAERFDPTGWTGEGRRARGFGLPVALGQDTGRPYVGNRFTIALVPVPWREPDLARRAQLIARHTARLKPRSTRWAHEVTLGRLGPRGVSALSDRVFARAGLQTTVVTAAADLGYEGREPLRVTPISCLPAHLPCLPALVVWRSQATCAFTADAAFPEARELAEHWRAALDELAPVPAQRDQDR